MSSRRGAGPRSGRHPVAFARGSERRCARDHRVRPGDRAGRGACRRPPRRRAGARPPAHRRPRAGSARSSRGWARWPACSAGATRLLAEPIPDVTPRAGTAPDRGQRARGPWSSPRSSACWSPPGWCTPTSAAWPRRRRSPRALARPLPDKALERRLEQSRRCRRHAARHREPRASPRRGARCTRPAQRLLRKLEIAAARARGGRRAVPTPRDGARRPLRDPGAPRLAQPARRHHPRRVAAAPAPSSSSPPRRSSWATRSARRRSRKSGRRSACCAS